MYQEDLQFLMVGIVSASDLDIKLSSYSPKSKISVEVHLVPHLKYVSDPLANVDYIKHFPRRQLY